MSLDTTNYDLSSVYSLGAVTNPNDTFSVLSLGKRFPAYYSLFQELVDSKKIPLTKNWKGELVAPASAWASAVEPYIHTDPLTIYRTLKKVRANPFDSQPPWLQKIYSEVWAKIPEYATTQKNVAPPKEEFEKFAASKLEEVKTLADNQVKLASAGPLRPNEFTYDGNLYTVNKMTSVNGEETLGENRAGSPYATLDVVDRSGKTDKLIFIPESYLTSGERTANKTFINGSFLDQDFLKDLNAINIRNKGSVDNLFAMRFGDSGFVISESKLKEKYPKISQSLNQGQASLNTTDDTELVSFAGKLAYKFKTQQDFQGIQYIATGVGPPIAYPVEKNDVTLDAYFTGDNYGDKVSFEKIGSGPGSGHVVRQGNVILDTIQLYPEPQKPDWGKFIAAGAGIWLAGSGLAAVLNPATTASFATQVGTAVGLSGTAAAVTGGAAIGAALYGAAGADPLTGAVLGGLGELATVSNYAEPVGRALGATTTKAAVVVGNIAISSALSGLSAAALGQDVGRSMLAGGITGGIKAGSQEIASTILGGPENLAKIADSLGFYGATGAQQVADILSASLAQGIVSEISGGRPFAEAFGQSLVANGVSTKVANEVVEGMRVNAPTTRAVFNATRQITSVATTAALNNQDVSLALENAAPGIILTSFKELTTPDKAVAEQVKQSQDEGMEEVPLSASDQDVLDEIKPQAPPDELLAGGDTSQLPVEDQELLNQIQDVAQRPDIQIPQDATETAERLRIVSDTPRTVWESSDGRYAVSSALSLFENGDYVRTLTPEEYESITGLKYQEETGIDGGAGTSSDTVAGGGGGDIAADIESIISGEGLVPEDVTEVVTDTTLPSDVQLPIVLTPTVAGGTAGGETIPQTPIGEVTDQEIKDVIDQQTPTVIGGEGETPITPTLPGGEQETTVVGGEAPTTVSGGETPTTVAGGEAETTVTGGEAPTTVDTITGGQVAEGGQASVPGGEISDEEIIKIIVGEGNVPPSGELPATTVVGGEEAPTTVVGGEDTTPGGLPDETITGEAGADTVVGGGDQVVEIAPTVPGGEQITPTIPGGEEITPTIPGGEGEISDEDLINIIIGEGTPTTAGGGGEDTVVGGEEIPTVPGGEQVLPTVPGGDVTDILQPTLPGGAGEGDTVVSGGGEADTVLGGGGEGEATLPGGEGEDTVGGGLGDGEITDQDIINIITGGDTGVGGGGEDTTLAGGGGDEVTPAIPGGDDEAILDLIRDLEQEEGMEEIPLEPETPVEEVTPPTTGTRPVVTVVPRQRTFQRPGEAAPYRVTGQDESGILGRKQPLFGGDEDLQRAEWNRRSLRLRRLLGL
jgi:hypothetical protein